MPEEVVAVLLELFTCFCSIPKFYIAFRVVPRGDVVLHLAQCTGCRSQDYDVVLA